MVPVRFSGMSQDTDILILSESVRVRGTLLESGLAHVRDGNAFILIHYVTHGSLTLQSGTCHGEALVYPAPIRESECPQSFLRRR